MRVAISDPVPRLAATVVAAALFGAGIGAARGRADGSAPGPTDASPGVIHSPAEVDRAFAAAGLAMTPAAWTVPRGDVRPAQLTSELLPNPAPFGLQVTTWSSIAAADKDVQDSAEIAAYFPDAMELQAGNVTARFTSTADTAPQVAQVRQALAALAGTPAVLPPPSGIFPLSAVAGSAATTVKGKLQVHLPGYDWWCEAETWVDSDGKRGPAADCEPWDATGASIGIGSPADIFHPSSLDDHLQVGSTSPARLVGVTRDRLSIYAFPFGRASASTVSLRSSSAEIVAASSGLGFPGTRWRCSARTKPIELLCYRTVNGFAETPFVLLLPGRRILEVEATVAPDLQSRETSPSVFYGYEFDT